MDVIKMYRAVDQMRDYIWIFNLNYGKQNLKIYACMLPFVNEICEIGLSDTLYWKNTEVDFRVVYDQIDNMKKAVEDEDIVYIYDKLNFEIRWFIKSIFEVLFKKSAKELRSLFWSENREALQKRYPEILKKIEEFNNEENESCIRDYGLRGNVIFRKNSNVEYDLYSTYSPGEVGVYTMINSDLKKYNKIYIWGFNGGYEISGGLFCFEDKRVEVEIYVTNLIEFKHILLNVPRKGMLLNPDVKWKFNICIEDFLKNIDLQKKQESYIYVTEYVDDGLTILKKFIYKYSLNSNIG